MNELISEQITNQDQYMVDDIGQGLDISYKFNLCFTCRNQKKHYYL